MRKEKARAIAICALINDAIKHGYPENHEGRMYMDAAIHWLEDIRHSSRAADAYEYSGLPGTPCDKDNCNEGCLS